jgi:hypothetical protein
MPRPVLERRGKPVQLTEEETELLDNIWETRLLIEDLEIQLVEAKARREKYIREARERRFFIREIAELAGLSTAGVCWVTADEDKKW